MNEYDDLNSERAELKAETDLLEAHGAAVGDLEAQYERMQEIDVALWEQDFGESLDALTALPTPQDLAPQHRPF